MYRFALSLAVALCTITTAFAAPHPNYEPPLPGKPKDAITVEMPAIYPIPDFFVKNEGADSQYLTYSPFRPYIANNLPKACTEISTQTPLQTVWKGEQFHTVFAVSGFDDGAMIRVENVKSEIPLQVKFLRYAKGDKGMFADIIDDAAEVRFVKGTFRYLIVTGTVPRKIKSGFCPITFDVVQNSTKKVSVSDQCGVQIENWTLPKVKDWKIHLDLWQTPQAIAEYHRVPLWSDAHFELMKPHYKLLADAGQKVITCEVIDAPWNAQAYTPLNSMIKWTQKVDGTWAYDYTIFDRWIEFMMKLGIDKQINCYSMVPWHLKFHYFDEATQKTTFIKAHPTSKEYEAHWGPFLKDLVKHMKAKGWLDKTVIAMDERKRDMILGAVGVVKKHAPELKLAMAFNEISDIIDHLYDACMTIRHYSDCSKDLIKHQKAGLPTTLYVCWRPTKPNTFTFSPGAEATWLPMFSAANNMDGFLRWAFDNWNENPMSSTDYGQWLTSDCFLVYPGARSSVRFENLRRGVQYFEKIQILRETAAKLDTPDAKAAIAQMNSALLELFVWSEKKSDYTESLAKAQAVIRTAQMALKKQK